MNKINASPHNIPPVQGYKSNNLDKFFSKSQRLITGHKKFVAGRLCNSKLSLVKFNNLCLSMNS